MGSNSHPARTKDHMTRPPIPYLARQHLLAADLAFAEMHRNPASVVAPIVTAAQVEAATQAIRMARVSR